MKISKELRRFHAGANNFNASLRSAGLVQSYRLGSDGKDNADVHSSDAERGKRRLD